MFDAKTAFFSLIFITYYMQIKFHKKKYATGIADVINSSVTVGRNWVYIVTQELGNKQYFNKLGHKQVTNTSQTHP